MFFKKIAMQQTTSRPSFLPEIVKTFTVGNWKIRTLPIEVPIYASEKSQLEKVANQWPACFNSEHANWMTDVFGVPSVVIRIDYTVTFEGKVNVYEIEDRPAGFEIDALASAKAFNAFVETLKNISEYANKPLGICVSRGRMFNSDDFYWAQRLKDFGGIRMVFGEVPTNPEDTIWFVRTLRDEKEYHALSPYSLTTIEYEGDKSYGIDLKLWKPLKYIVGGMDSFEGIYEFNRTIEIPWNKPFVVKPGFGCRCENVHLYHPKRPSNGFSTKTKIEKAIANNEVYYIQEYYEPESPAFLPTEYAMIRRCYLVFDIASKAYKVIGGQWEARPNCHKIHGASDAVCGPLVVT